MKFKNTSILFLFIIYGIISNGQGNFEKKGGNKLISRLKRSLMQGISCPDPDMCLSQWGYCGNGSAYCGQGCQNGPCTDKNSTDDNNITNNNSTYNNSTHIINRTTFKCAFNDLDNATRRKRFHALKRSGWKPVNANDAAVFLAQVYHETGGLQTLVESCAPGKLYFIRKLFILIHSIKILQSNYHNQIKAMYA
jgi:hypothetical protein